MDIDMGSHGINLISHLRHKGHTQMKMHLHEQKNAFHLYIIHITNENIAYRYLGVKMWIITVGDGIQYQVHTNCDILHLFLLHGAIVF